MSIIDNNIIISMKTPLLSALTAKERQFKHTKTVAREASRRMADMIIKQH